MHSFDGLAESCWSYCLFLSFHQKTQKRLGHTLYGSSGQTRHCPLSYGRRGSRLLWVAYRLKCSHINSPASADLSRFCFASICWSAHCCPHPATMRSRHACSSAPPCGSGTQCQAVETAACANKWLSWVTSSEHKKKLSPKHIAGIINLQRPVTQKQMSLLGMCPYCRCIFPH